MTLPDGWIREERGWHSCFDERLLSIALALAGLETR